MAATHRVRARHPKKKTLLLRLLRAGLKLPAPRPASADPFLVKVEGAGAGWGLRGGGVGCKGRGWGGGTSKQLQPEWLVIFGSGGWFL